MLVILKDCLSCAPRGTTPKSCAVVVPKSLSAQADPWARAGWVNRAVASRVKATVRMLDIPFAGRGDRVTRRRIVPGLHARVKAGLPRTGRGWRDGGDGQPRRPSFPPRAVGTR